MSNVPEGLANGPSRSDHIERDAQVWERPWTLEEMRHSSANWSLAADSGLFLFLQDFSQRMLSKTHDIEKQLDSLIRDTKATDSCLHSVFNDFLMLSNTQFIENRVYDEEIEEAIPKIDASEKQPEQEKTREQKEAELIPKMQEAVNFGLKVLESAFEHLDIKAGNSDSEDEEATDRVETILEPKDLYVDRPLPYLIGSQAFMEQDDVGLGDLSSDEMSVDSDRDSVIDSEDGKEAVQSDEDFNQDDDHEPTNIKKKSSMISFDDDDEEDDDSDIFGESDKEEDNDFTKNTGPSSFADELAARIKGEPVNKLEGDRASLASKKKIKVRKEPKSSKPPADEDSDDMFKPPKMDDDDLSPFGGKSGLFSGGRGLFDDDDEGDLFSEAPKPPPSEERKAPSESMISTVKTTEPSKSGKKIPAGGVSIFPDNLFSSGNESDTEESKTNGIPPPRTNTISKQVGGGLFDDEEDEDDFFGNKSLKRSDSTGKERLKKAVDLFVEEEDEDGDIFSNTSSVPATHQGKTEAVGAQIKAPEKKMPAGAVSLFGPGTKNLLSEGLKKRQPSTSEESEKSEETGPPPDIGQAAVKKHMPETKGLFSDDEEPQVFPTIPKSRSQPESTNQKRHNKDTVSLFDDEEEEDLFASATKCKPKPNQTEAPTPQPTKTVSLFSDDEDQWLVSKTSETKSENKMGGMKASVSAPSNLPGTKTALRNGLFDNDEDDDLFAPTKESSQKRPQRVALLFEDEDEDKGSLFSTKSVVSAHTAAPAKTPDVTTKSHSLPEKSDKIAVLDTTTSDKSSVQEKPTSNPPNIFPNSQLPENSEAKKKPAGAVSLFGGINVLASKQTKSPLDEVDQDEIISFQDSPPSVVEEKKEEKVKTNAVSLFDDEEEDESDWNDPIFTPSKMTKESQKVIEERQQAKSTGVFQDEELLFSQTQQKDNDPDVDLFASSGKQVSSKLSTAKPAAQSLFADEDEDDLFSSIKTKPPPPEVQEKPSKTSEKAPLASPEPSSESQKPAASPVKPKDSSSRIGKLQASLMINPTALLPGAAPSMPGSSGMGLSSSSGVSSSSLSPSPLTSPSGPLTDNEGGVSFDIPVKASTLQSANKSRAKGAVHRRPQSRAARQQAAQRSLQDKQEIGEVDVSGPKSGRPGLVVPPSDKSNVTEVSPTLPNKAPAVPASTMSQPSPSQIFIRPSELTLPVSNNATKKESGNDVKGVQSSDEDDLFGSDGLFVATAISNSASTRPTNKTTQPQATSGVGLKKDKDRSTLPSIFDDNDDLFKKVKPMSITKKAKPSAFLEEDDDDEDIFGLSNSSTPTPSSNKEIKSSSSLSKQDIFQDEVTIVPKVHKKHKEKTLDASLFDDNVDIFADLTDTLKSKQKSKTKGETKSIFDDDMDDIFSPSTVKPAAKVLQKSKKTAPPQETASSSALSSIFDDPLNAMGGH